MNPIVLLIARNSEVQAILDLFPCDTFQKKAYPQEVLN